MEHLQSGGHGLRLMLVIVLGGMCSQALRAGTTVWKFDNPSARLAAASGTATLNYYDPAGSGWGAANSTFGKASTLGLPAMPGGDADVMQFPACTPQQGYYLLHASPPNGPYGETHGRVSNYTLILDLLYPSASDGRWRALYQVSTNNSDEADFFVQNAPSGGVGIINVYNGSIRPNTWHRVAIVMRSAPGEGACQRFIDGRFVGGIGSTGSGFELRWALTQALLLFTDDDGETAPGYVASIGFVDRPMTIEEIERLGGPHADGVFTPGNPAPALEHRMARRVGAIGHRGGFFCCAPDNTLAAVRRAISNQVPVIEIDTRLSADGVCVLVHDSTVDRTTDGTGAVVSKTVAQLKALDAGSWFAPEFAGERIPTVAEVMAESKGKLILYFDLKVPGQINAITNALAQTGFDADDCWFWTYNNATDSAAIRSRLPNAKIIWEAPASWATDPNFFSNMRNIGVYGFDQGVYYGAINPAFVRAAKQEGFMVSIYTILDPDTMVRNAALGVDYMETDFPHIMNQIQPAQFAAATQPTPTNGAPNIAPSPMLTWVTGSNATAHRIYFGIEPSPPFLREQAYDVVPFTNLLAGSTYHWRVDEVTPSGIIPGQVWSFTVAADVLPTAAYYEWTFDGGTLAPALGNGIMEFADGATMATTILGQTDGTTIPHLGGQPGSYLHAPALTGQGNGFLLTFRDSGPNGGGVYMNQFTFLADIMIPGPLGWTALFNTNPENPSGNDADFYVAQDGGLGIGALGYGAAGTIAPDTWHRIAFVADLGAGLTRFYRDGTQVHQRTGASLLDGRFSLYSNQDLGPDLLLLNEGDTSGAYTHEIYLASVAFSDRVLTAAEIAALGGPRAEGIFVRRLHVARNSSGVTLTWDAATNVGLQKAATLPSPVWETVPGTVGTGTYIEATPGGMAFYRLASPLP